MSRASRARARRSWPHVILLDPLVPGLALARRMTRLGARVTAIEDKPYAARSRNVESIIAPYVPGSDRWLHALEELAQTCEQAVVLPGSDRASELLARAGDLPENLRAFECDTGSHLALMNKAQASAIASRAGVSVPWSARVVSEEDFALASPQAPWPCVIKPELSHEWRELYGEERSFLVDSPEVARELLEAPLEAGLAMLLCQYIPGADDDVEEAIVVRLADGSYPVRFGCRKLRQYPAGFGSTAVAWATSAARTPPRDWSPRWAEIPSTHSAHCAQECASCDPRSTGTAFVRPLPKCR
jgi:predicted ATP-grasp superfamily ATP-dependent carboligase